MTTSRRSPPPSRSFRSVGWKPSPSSNAAGVYKCQKYLLYDYLHKIGSFLCEEVSRDRRFWPLRPSPGVKQEFRGAENWSEAALVAREIKLRKDANKALETHAPFDARGPHSVLPRSGERTWVTRLTSHRLARRCVLVSDRTTPSAQTKSAPSEKSELGVSFG